LHLEARAGTRAVAVAARPRDPVAPDGTSPGARVPALDSLGAGAGFGVGGFGRATGAGSGFGRAASSGAGAGSGGAAGAGEGGASPAGPPLRPPPPRT